MKLHATIILDQDDIGALLKDAMARDGYALEQWGADGDGYRCTVRPLTAEEAEEYGVSIKRADPEELIAQTAHTVVSEMVPTIIAAVRIVLDTQGQALPSTPKVSTERVTKLEGEKARAAMETTMKSRQRLADLHRQMNEEEIALPQVVSYEEFPG